MDYGSCILTVADCSVRKDVREDAFKSRSEALRDAILAAVKAYDAANPVPVSTLEFLLASELLQRDAK